MSNELPQWQRELLNFKGIKSLIVLEKNISDLYPWWDSAIENPPVEDISFLDINATIRGIFNEDSRSASYQVIHYNPISRFVNPFQDPAVETYLAAADREASQMRLDDERINSYGNSNRGGQQNESPIVHDTRLIRALLTRNLGIQPSAGDQGMPPSEEQLQGQQQIASPSVRPVVVIIDVASRLLTSSSAIEPDEIAAFSNLLSAVRDSIRSDSYNRNTLVMVVNNLRDLPEWFVSSNPDLRSIVVPTPDRDNRKLYVRSAFKLLDVPTASDEKAVSERFIDKTDGMSLRELDELRRMFERQNLPESELCSLVDIYKYGLKENKWESVRETLERDPEGAIKHRVKGQDDAVKAVVSVLKRSTLGLSGATHSSGSKPKGILFLSGPTGTGKTEIVKAVTELLFGDERSLLRFDMSEYQADNADQKLFGAPPGYVGYAEGGQLTNAVKANPFSVILFDEIEKATSSIMDKFLQILEDGRMTDGQGNTVYFSETIIFFTSNIGFSREVFDPSGRHVIDHVTMIEPDEPYEEIRSKVLDSMRASFKPEFLGRIGNNVVVFNYIDDDSAGAIVNARIEQINRTVEKQHGVIIDVDPECVAHLTLRALQTDVKEKGGRGIGNLIETEYLNTLSDYLFDSHARSGETVRVTIGEQGLVCSKLGLGASDV